jgi:hypothetical protein
VYYVRKANNKLNNKLIILKIMKTRTILKLTAILVAVVGINVAGCKKDKTDNSTTDTNSMQQLSKDEVAVDNATNDVLNDANTVLSGGSSKKSIDNFPCNATIDSISHSTVDTIVYYMTFNGLNCSGNHTRTGNVIIKRPVGVHWINAGATVSVTYVNFKITKISSGKSLTINGTKLFENVSGGLLVQLGGSITSVTHKISGSIQATFDDGTTRTWTIARQRVFTGTLGNLVVAESGFGSADGYNNLVVWGTNRNGEAFYTQLTTSVIFRESCGWDPESGVKVHQIPSDTKSATITFGYDNSNNLITGSSCATKYKLDWVKGTHSGTIYLFLP